MTTILVHPRVLASITAALRRQGLRKRDLPDAIAEVQTRVLEWARNNPLPTEIDSVTRVCTTVAINWCIDEARRRDTARPHDMGLCEDPDERLPSAPSVDREHLVDVGRQLEVFLDEVREGRMPPNALEVAVRLAEGKTQAEIAEELATTEASVHRTTANLRKRLRQRLVALGLLTLVVMVLVATLLVPLAGVARREQAPPRPSRGHDATPRLEIPELGSDRGELLEREAKPH